MNTPARQAHWQKVYETKGERQVSRFEESPAISMALIKAAGVDNDASIINVGGGASRLADAVLAEGFTSVTMLDISEKALTAARERLGARGAGVRWIVADVTTWQISQIYDVWHDRAALYFLIEAVDRAAYGECVHKAVQPGGNVIIGTFARDGLQHCCGLPVLCHDAASLAEILGRSFKLIETRRHDHRTPTGTIQHFQFSEFRRWNSCDRQGGRRNQLPATK